MSKKQTAGEKIMAASVGREVKEFRASPLYPMERKTAARIDAAIQRAVRKKDVRITELACEVERLKAALDTWTAHRKRD